MKKFRVLIIFLIFNSLIIISCNYSDNSKANYNKESNTFNIEAAKKEIDKANLEFIDLFNKRDSVGLANMFTIDGKSMEPNEPSFNGRSEI